MKNIEEMKSIADSYILLRSYFIKKHEERYNLMLNYIKSKGKNLYLLDQYYELKKDSRIDKYGIPNQLYKIVVSPSYQGKRNKNYNFVRKMNDYYIYEMTPY